MQFEDAKKFILNRLQGELPAYLSYHRIEHTKDVYRSAEFIAKEEGVSGEDLLLLLTAVLFHDSGFLVQSKDHELISCDIAREHLPGFGYMPLEIDRICGMIMATKLPQSPANLLEEIICDADLDYLGRDDFYEIGRGLFDELRVYGMLSNETEWNNLQIRFLESHHYFTKTSLKLRKPKKERHLEFLKSTLKK